MSASPDAYSQLSRGVQKWVHRQGWPDLRPIQKAAILAFHEVEDDLVIAAPTAGGKTEAAFLPICSGMTDTAHAGIRVLCISPLKALINDHYQRLSLMGRDLGISVHAWHGDVPQGKKRALLKNPSGILLITPESLEALFMRRGGHLKRIFAHLDWIVIDELHVFIISERGKQIQSQLHRLEFLLGRRIRRIGLSATLGDLRAAGETLRPGGPYRILTEQGGAGTLKLSLKGVLVKNDREPQEPVAPLTAIAEHLFQKLRGKNNLVFANSRQRVEQLANHLRSLCAQAELPLEFFPHHGSLAKDFREHVEARLKKDGQVTTAVCTSTLELGIDIGSVHTVGQIGSPPAVASLRQRLGRSGRRDGVARLRVYAIEYELTGDDTPADLIRPDIFRTVAMISLLLEGWNEPLTNLARHPSTFVHQILSVITQYGGAGPHDLWRILCAGSAPFSSITKAEFIDLLKHLKSQDLIQQMADGLIIPAPLGESLTEHYGFYAVFKTDEEYRLEVGGKNLGTLPISYALFEQKTLLFAGKPWRIIHVDEDKKVVSLVPAPGGKPPRFMGDTASVHDQVRRRMKALYLDPPPSYLDHEAQDLYLEGQRAFHQLGLAQIDLVACGKRLYFFPWLGDTILTTITLLFKMWRLNACHAGPVVIFEDITEQDFNETVLEILAQPPLTPQILAELVLNKKVGKFDGFVPTDLLDQEIAVRDLDLPGALACLSALKGVQSASS